MRLPMILKAGLAGLAMVATPAASHQPAASGASSAVLAGPVKDAAAAVDAFHAALQRGDGPAAAALLADDALVFEAGGVERSKAEYSAQHLGADMVFSQAVPSTVTRRTGGLSGKLAWVASEGRTTGSYKDKPIDRITTETMVLRASGSGWKIVHVHWSSAAAPQRTPSN
jgi:ketosteroid isomerase-like protein